MIINRRYLKIIGAGEYITLEIWEKLSTVKYKHNLQYNFNNFINITIILLLLLLILLLLILVQILKLKKNTIVC